MHEYKYVTNNREPDTEWPVEHRPWALPNGPWLMYQEWSDLMFAHWSVPLEALRPFVPAALSLDSFGGSAWIGVTPFEVRNARAHYLPAIPGTSAFPEINVRTYVMFDNKPGIYFFSLDTTNPLAVVGARSLFRLPYFNAAMHIERDGSFIKYSSRRTDSTGTPPQFEATYWPTGAEFVSAPGSLEHFLVERYCLYTLDPAGRVCRADIHHAPWRIQPAEAEWRTNTMVTAQGLPEADSKPLLHFAKVQKTKVWKLDAVDAA
jgi:uncharacterized protein YqjF (DUF2071 family)